MAIVSTDFLAATRTAYMALFDQVQGEAQNLWSNVAMSLPAGNKAIVQFNWLGAPPMPRLWSGELEFGKSFTHDYNVTVLKYGVGKRIDRDIYRRDSLGTIALHMKQFMAQAMKWKDYLIFTQVSAGFATVCFDGQYFYDTDHSVGDAGTHDNVGTAALSAADPAEYNAAWKAINTAKDDAGQPMGFMPTLLVIHPDNRYTAKKLIKAERLSSGATNVLAGDVEVLAAPYLATEGEWHLIAGNEVMKPFILVVDEEFSFTPNDGLTSDGVFYREQFEYKVLGQMATCFGDFRMAYASDGSA